MHLLVWLTAHTRTTHPILSTCLQVSSNLLAAAAKSAPMPGANPGAFP